MHLEEIDWIDYLKRKVFKGKDVLAGVGDDSALVKIKKDKILLKSDLFIEDIHFKLKNISFETIGMRAVARVISDFAACGGVPKFIGISLGKPNYIKKTHLKKILEGILKFSKIYKFFLVGGDTSKAFKLFLDVWGVGIAEKYISRSNAKVDDYIFVTGRLGLNSYNMPFFPKVKEAQNLVKNFKINSMIDISDGFILDLYRILHESNKGAIVYKDKLPLTKGLNDIYRGEDYELIFTVSKDERRLDFLKQKFYLVGKIVSKKNGYKFKGGEKIFIKGYTHF
ncbi:MAG: thiamine-phosphate kinase [Candidatus Omnitrophica bacterium]|nr:thiamine-phosphate kinase [Candidatus Omnitrophota bacterium]